MTVVSGHCHVDTGYAVLGQFYPQVARALVEAQQDVLVRTSFLRVLAVDLLGMTFLALTSSIWMDA